MKFYDALKALDEKGQSISREDWEDLLYVSRMAAGKELGSISVPFLFACDAYGNWVPWTPTQSDLFAIDWFVMEPSKGRFYPEGATG